MIEVGRRVGVIYEGRLENGEVFDSSAWHGGRPLEFVVGSGQVISGLERVVSEMSARERRTVKISAREAYGERDEGLVERIPARDFPDSDKLPVGEYIMLDFPGGRRRLKVVSVDGEEIVFDGNHELAGCDLTFDLEVVSVLGETGSLVENEQHSQGCTCGCHCFREQSREGVTRDVLCGFMQPPVRRLPPEAHRAGEVPGMRRAFPDGSRGVLGVFRAAASKGRPRREGRRKGRARTRMCVLRHRPDRAVPRGGFPCGVRVEPRGMRLSLRPEKRSLPRRLQALPDHGPARPLDQVSLRF